MLKAKSSLMKKTGNKISVKKVTKQLQQEHPQPPHKKQPEATQKRQPQSPQKKQPQPPQSRQPEPPEQWQSQPPLHLGESKFH